ncbi:MAG: LysR family transcriptional regulator [Hyphomicrobiales bacterium]|nr:LysR family transcriptional regulator [Hyphomicrobiales bacterium]PCH50700.1 MAG: LysR family transcriptional regulator [Hyphomicrobiales bacterium]
MNFAIAAFDWNQVRAFLATAENGSLSAAARLLGQTQPTLSRQIIALEQSLGVTLFERIGKRLVITESGKDLLEHAKQMGDAANAFSLSASGRTQIIAGLVRISVSDLFSIHLMPKFLQKIQTELPQIKLEIVVSNTLSDLQRREADIAIRHVRPTQPELIGKFIGESSAGLYASHTWIEKHGEPKTLLELCEHSIISIGNIDEMISILRENGLPLTHENLKIRTDSGILMWEMIRKGLGIGVLTSEVSNNTPELKQLVPDLFPPIPVPTWLVTHKELNTSRRIRLVFDMLADYLKEIRRD